MTDPHWIRLDRTIRENPLWPTGKYTKVEAAIDYCLFLADQEQPPSHTFLATRWRWRPPAVARFLSELSELIHTTDREPCLG